MFNSEPEYEYALYTLIHFEMDFEIRILILKTKLLILSAVDDAH